MDRLADHEAFLRAIFDAPADDTPRLVYADFLEDHGDPGRAAFIRLTCEAARLPEDDPGRAELLAAADRAHAAHPLWPKLPDAAGAARGFRPPPATAWVEAAALADPGRLRAHLVAVRPEFFGARAVKVVPPPRLGPEQVAALLGLPFAQQVAEWDFAGSVEEVAAPAGAEDAGTYGLIDLHHEPVITVEAVEALAEHRGARRITALDLTNNNLDNDAARALVRSPYLINLRRLDVLEGNRLRGRTWQELLNRFGPEVVG